MACAPAEDGATPLLEGDGFFDRPFPSDSRLLEGRVDVSEFPAQDEVELIGRYVAHGTDLEGWGLSSPIYVRFAEDIDPDLLPDTASSQDPGSPIWLVDVDPGSPHRGERVAVETRWTAVGNRYEPDRLLAVAPVWGMPLRPATTYALVLLPPLARPGAMPEGWQTREEWRDLADWLTAEGLDPERVAAATVFTTQDPRADMARIARAIHEELDRPPQEPALERVEARAGYHVYQGHVTVPVWQAGERPYRDEGGSFVFDEDGAPRVQAWERVRFSLSVPKGEAPAAGWPVVLYSHGTGGDDTSFWSSGNSWDESYVAASRGAAMIGIAQPLHGDRATPDTNTELDSFNFTNPDAGRSNFRQGALDQVWLARWLAEGVSFEADSGTIALDPDRIAFFGHSQGGLVGAIAAPYMAADLRGAGFSGTGGGMSLTLMLRKDPLDLAELMAAALGVEPEELSTLHPAVGLVQMFSEVTDPLNYGSAWFFEDPGVEGRPLSIVMTEGTDDPYTPAVTTEALAAAAGVPIVGEAASAPLVMDLRGLGPEALPVTRNVEAWTGEALTAGLGQYPDRKSVV